MAKIHNRKPRLAVRRARALRRRSTEAEKLLWEKLRSRGVAGHKFRRQYPLGSHVADFACVTARLVIEIDGGQHSDMAAIDARRSALFEARGYRVIRFWNNEVFENLDRVLSAISLALTAPSPSRRIAAGPSLSRKAGEGRGEGVRGEKPGER